MRVLVATNAHPLPAADGLSLQLSNLLQGLSRRHEVTLVSAVHPWQDTDPERLGRLCAAHVGVPHAGGLRARLGTELRTLRGGGSVLADQVTSGPLPEAVLRAAARLRPEVVHLSPGWMVGLAAPLRALLPGTAIVLAPLDASAPNVLADDAVDLDPLHRFLSRREGRRLVRLERTAYRDVDAVVVVTETDAALLAPGLPGVPVRVVTNGVDQAHWARPADRGPRAAGTVVLSGAMGYPPNVDAARFAATEVLPALRQRVPGARLVLVGRDPSPEVRALAGEHVEVTGTVDDVRPHLWDAAAYLCPMRTGTGVKNKLLEALAASAPSVVTPLATAGLDLVDGRDALVRADAAGLAAALVRVLTDPGAAQGLAEGARARALDLGWDRTVAGFEAVYAEARERARPR